MKKLAFFCRKLKRDKKIVKSTVDNGKVKIKIRENDRWKIHHELDLMDIFPTYDFGEYAPQVITRYIYIYELIACALLETTHVLYLFILYVLLNI